MAQEADPFFRFHIEHIVATQHRGTDEIDNLALACHRCNAYKGPNLSSVDAKTNQVVSLFHPRRQRWQEHFKQIEGQVHGLTPTGRATVQLLQMNAPCRVELRAT